MLGATDYMTSEVFPTLEALVKHHFKDHIPVPRVNRKTVTRPRFVEVKEDQPEFINVLFNFIMPMLTSMGKKDHAGKVASTVRHVIQMQLQVCHFLSGEPLGYGLWMWASYFNHSCDPNSHIYMEVSVPP